MPEQHADILIYQAEDGKTKVSVRLQDDSAWLTQATLAELYQTTPQNITLHIKAIYGDGELTEEATCKEFLQVRTEGRRSIQRRLKHYNLDMVLAVGYRVRSPRGIQFRQWATERLREYIVKGFTMDDERLKMTYRRADYFDELLVNRISVMFLDQAEFRVQRRQDIRMKDWELFLDKFLRDSAGSVSLDRLKAETAADERYIQDLRNTAKALENEQKAGKTRRKEA